MAARTRLERELEGLEMLKHREHTSCEEDALDASSARVRLLMSLSSEQLTLLHERAMHEATTSAAAALVDAQYAQAFREERNEGRAKDYDREEARTRSLSEAFRILAELLKVQ